MIIIRKSHSLQQKIVIFSLIIVITPLLLVGTISYIKSSAILQNKISLSHQYTVKQAGNNIEFILQNTHDFSLYLFQNDTVKAFLGLPPEAPYKLVQQKKSQVNRELMYLLNSKKYIHSVYLAGINGYAIDTMNAQKQLDTDILQKARSLKGAPLWLPHEIINFDGTTTYALSIVRVINDIDHITKELGILKINLPEDYLANIYADDLIYTQGHTYLIDRNHRIISSREKELLGASFSPALLQPALLQEKSGYYQARDERGTAFLVTYYKLDYVDWILIDLVPLAELFTENKVIMEVTVFSIIIGFLLCTLMIFFFNSKILYPLNQVRQVMQELERENFEIRLDFKGDNEIAVLGKTFNKMSARLKELMHQVYLERIKQKEAELKALQAQVNPHFLYNTLDTIYWMSRMEKAPETSNMVRALGKLFRLSLNNGDELTTVRKELEHLENYLIIQKKRYTDMISFSIEVDQKLLECKVIKLVLQPLVENAIYHGIEKNGGQGHVRVEIKRQGDYILYRISDDGVGINVAEVTALLEKVGPDNRGLGLKNVNDRIKLYFQDDSGLTFQNNTGSGTTVIVKQKCLDPAVFSSVYDQDINSKEEQDD